jgi:CHAT domain-containing protein
MPVDTALVEIVSYHPYDARARNRSERYGHARYGAYVLPSNGPPKSIDLGDAATINNDVAALREALISPRSKNTKQLGQALYAKVMQPLVTLAGNTQKLFLSPDGDLNLIPFGALVDEQGRYVVENYSITYLTSGRDLLRLKVHTGGEQGPIIFADPSFDLSVSDSRRDTGGTLSSELGAGRRSTDLREAKFSALPGTAGEAKALAEVIPNVRVLTGPQATEAALKQVSGPRILHVATHGFFLPDQLREGTQANAESQAGRGLGISRPGEVLERQTSHEENPLLRSGLAFAGVNQRQSGTGEDGVLTALEASGLDLWGTRLVVLSACETGLGEVRNGEGVYGLRRALVLAGSESQVMSLWQVSDAATRDLMAAYYKRLKEGEGRTEALRQVQLMMIRSGRQKTGGPTSAGSTQERGLGIESGNRQSEDRSHPFYWASFIQSGDWRKL